MNKNKKISKAPLIVSIAILVYIVLLLLLVHVESASPESGITTIQAGLWYTITTLTTVGYGDLYPVTSSGKIIGAVFQLMSLGVLVALFSFMLSFLRGKFVPRQKLGFSRKKQWYIFAERNRFTESLAAGLEKERPDGSVIFSEEKRTIGEGPGFGAEFSPSELLEIKKGKGNASLFFMSENILDNEQRAKQFESTGSQIYCMTAHEPEQLPANIHIFDPYRICARAYWKRFPIENDHENIVMIGGGKYASGILEQAMIQNVLDPHQAICYRMYGNYNEFIRLHPYLETIVTVGQKDPDRDSLIFSKEPWSSALDIIAEADRIIVCTDREEDTILTLILLFKYCPVQGKVYARLSMPFDSTEVFGSYSEVFAPEHVLRDELNRYAVRLHEMYMEASPGRYPPWNELGCFLRGSNLAAADHLEYKLRILLGPEAGNTVTPELCRRAFEVYKGLGPEDKERCRAIEHERWMRFHIMNNWHYGEPRDNKKRLHPLLRPYEELSPKEREKDDYGWRFLEELGNLPD